MNIGRITKIVSLITIVTLLTLSAAVSALAAYPRHTDFVSDGAVIIDENAEKSIIKASDKLYTAKGTRIAVCTVLNTSGEDIEDFGANLFKEWKVKDGVLILLSIEEDNFYAVQSNSLSEYLPASELKSILNSNLEPAFAERDYSDGVNKTVNALANYLSNRLPDDFGANAKSGLPGWAVAIIVIVVVIAVIAGGTYTAIILIRRRNIRRRREEMELRRRRLRDGRGRETLPPPRGVPYAPNGRPTGAPRANIPQGRPSGNPQRPMPASGNQTRPVPPAGNQTRPVHPAGRAPQRRPAPNGAQAAPQRPNPTNAATIQINTSDIRAAKQNKRP